MIPILRITQRRYIPPEDGEETGRVEIDLAVEGADSVPARRYMFPVLPLSPSEITRTIQQLEDQALYEAHQSYKRDFGIECAVGV